MPVTDLPSAAWRAGRGRRGRVQFGLQTLLAAFVALAILFGWLCGRIKFAGPPGSEPSCVAGIGNLSVYRWQASRPVAAWRVLIDGEESRSGTSSNPSTSVQLAIVEDDGATRFHVEIGGGVWPVTVPMRLTGPREGLTSIPSVRSLPVDGPTRIYYHEDAEMATGRVLRTVEVLVE